MSHAMDTYRATHCLAQNDHALQVHLHHLWLLHGGLVQARRQEVLPPLQVPCSRHHWLLIGHVQQLVKIPTT